MVCPGRGRRRSGDRPSDFPHGPREHPDRLSALGEGQAPERIIDPSLDRTAPNPGQGFKRGFVVACFSPKFFGGMAEMASASIHTSNAIRDVYAAFEEQSGQVENRGKVPLVARTGAEAMKDKYGTNYRPKLEVVRWVDRPAELPDASPVDEVEVWKGGPAPAQSQPAASTHAPPPTRQPSQPRPIRLFRPTSDRHPRAPLGAPAPSP